VIRSREVAARVFGDLAERYRARPGGYTRVLKLRRRVGDSAPLSLLELVEGGEAATAETAAKAPAGRKKAGEKAAKARKAAAAGKEAAGGRSKAETAGRKARPGGKGKAKSDVAARKPAAPRKTGRSSKSD
jgi:large subunit ribosomal protein L17